MGGESPGAAWQLQSTVTDIISLEARERGNGLTGRVRWSNPGEESETKIVASVIYERQLTDKVNSVSFSDCEDDKINFLSGAGIIYGMGDGTFAPDESITREQASTILYRTAEFLGNKTMPTAIKMVYTDESEISDWAKPSVACMNAMGIMNGVSKKEFAPKQTYTVEQAIATMLRLYECN